MFYFCFFLYCLMHWLLSWPSVWDKPQPDSVVHSFHTSCVFDLTFLILRLHLCPSCWYSLYLPARVCIFKVHTRCTFSIKLPVKPVHLQLLLPKPFTSKPLSYLHIYETHFFLPGIICKNNNFMNIDKWINELTNKLPKKWKNKNQQGSPRKCYRKISNQLNEHRPCLVDSLWYTWSSFLQRM